MSERYLITGALGCIGAWITRNLVDEGHAVSVFDLGNDPRRLELIMSPEGLSKVNFIQGDITDLATVKQAFAAAEATQVIHLAGLQVPACRANPTLGAQVNVIGTVNVFEAAKAAQLKRVVYASSIAVYGPAEDYPPGLIAHDALPKPRTHYGVYKQANEGTARLYWQDEGISSIGLRPYVVYGPARDQGLTSAPTKAMLAAVLGQPYHIGYGGHFDMQFADDVAKLFVLATRAEFEGADVFNLEGSIVTMPEVIETITDLIPESRGQITYDDVILPFPPGFDGQVLKKTLNTPESTSLRNGIAQSIAMFREAVAAGKLSTADL